MLLFASAASAGAGAGRPVLTVSLMSGISTVAGAEAMSAVDAAQSGTASALMGTLMFVFGGIARRWRVSAAKQC